MRGRMTGTTRIAIGMAFAAVLLGGCASTRVYREPGATSVPSRAKYGATTTVRRGDTLFAIASRNDIRAQDLAAWNGIPSPYTIYPGQKLKLYPGSGSASSPRPAATTGTKPSSGTAATPTTKPATPKPATPAAPAASDIKWRWPADGQLIGRYVAGEPTKQGIDIAGNSGAPVRAAADGVVVYSGSGLVGYGELIIIKHNDQWLSAYGHNRNRLVNEGQLVRAGQQIAEMGRSGAPREMLHFEVRYNGKPVDPLLYLPKQ